MKYRCDRCRGYWHIDIDSIEGIVCKCGGQILKQEDFDKAIIKKQFLVMKKLDELENLKNEIIEKPTKIKNLSIMELNNKKRELEELNTNIEMTLSKTKILVNNNEYDKTINEINIISNYLKELDVIS